jgi:PhnB protein
MGMESTSSLRPLLVVRDAARALDFYVSALNAKVLVSHLNNLNGTISHADLGVGDAVFSVTEEARGWNSDAPTSLGGSPVVLQLSVENVDAAVIAMGNAGASVVFPIQEFCGERMARLRDPFGHLWILSQHVEELSIEEKQRRRDALLAQFALVAKARGRSSDESKNE